MTILVYGLFTPDALEHAYARAFRALGHRVVPFDVAREGRMPWLRNRLVHRLTRTHFGSRCRLSQEFNRHLLATVERERPTLLIAFRGDFLMPETARRVREIGCRLVIFNPDNPFPPAPSARPEHLRTAQATDLYLIWSTPLAERLVGRGVNARFFPFGWDPEFHPCHPPEGPKTHEVVFIGNWDRRREAFLEKIAGHFDLKIWGGCEWHTCTKRNSRLKTCWQGGPVVGAALSEAVAQSAIVLNLFRDQHALGGVVMRTFEVPGAGGFLLSEANDEARRLFPEGETGAYFTDAADCVEKIRHWLAYPAERAALARRCARRVADEFTYERLAGALLAHGCRRVATGWFSDENFFRVKSEN
jgi:hypothetical protein